MQTLTGQVAVNAAFLQEIKQDNHELGNLLHQATTLLAARRSVHIDFRRLANLLGKLRDRLAMHFSLEESFGYFEDAVAVAPRLSRRAEALRSEHSELFVQCQQLAERAEGLLYHETSSRAIEPLAADFTAFCGRLRRHEDSENELVMQALAEDIGVGD
jgi:hypothetical protein